MAALLLVVMLATVPLAIAVHTPNGDVVFRLLGGYYGYYNGKCLHKVLLGHLWGLNRGQRRRLCHRWR